MAGTQGTSTQSRGPSARGAHVNRSGTITAGGAAQTAAPQNSNRRSVLIQNPSADDGGIETFWISFDATAVPASPSIAVAIGQTLVFEGSFIPTGALSIIAASTGTPFTIKEG